jgi:3-methyladenine DNA glycosylase Tag
MSKAVFQSGMSWQVVNAKWSGTNEAFHGFEIGRVAALTEEELDELAQDRRVIRNRRKLAAILHNAQRIIELDAGNGGFRNYLRSHDDFYSLVKDLRKQFKFLGDTGCYFFLYVVGEEVPAHDEWMCAQERAKRRR